MDKTLIFTATYNESENIISFIKLIENLNLELDLLIIDDNSPDNTWKLVKKYSVHKKFINLIIRDSKKGLDSAHKYAYTFAKEKKYKYLITLDADLSHDPLIIPEILKNLQNNDFVIGSRYINGGECDMKGFRRALSIMGNKVIKYVLKINCNEFTTSYRGFNLIKLEDFDLNIVKSKGYSFFMETIYQLNKKKKQIKEIPIIFKDRQKGKSKIPKVEIFRTFVNLFITKLLR